MRYPSNKSVKRGTPKEIVILPLISRLGWERLQIGRDLYNKHCRWAFRGYQHGRPWTTLNLKNRKFQWIFRNSRPWRTFQEWIVLKSLEIDQYNLHKKFSSLNVDFNSLSFVPLGSRSSPYGASNLGAPSKQVTLACCTLIREVAAPMLSHVSRALAQISG